MKVRYIASFFLMLSIIMLAFTAMPYNKELLRQMHGQGSFYPLLIVVILYYYVVFVRKKIFIYEKEWFSVILFFIATVGFGFMFNYESIISSVLIDRSGLTRFFSQLLVLIFGISVVLSIQYFIGDEYLFDKMIFATVVAFIVIFVFGVLEFLAYEFGGGFFSVYKFLVRGFSNEWKMMNIEKFSNSHFYKLSSVSQEAAHLSFTYAALGPYFISYCFIERKKHFLLLYIIIGVLSYSTSMYYVLLLQLFVYTYYVIFKHTSFYKLIFYFFFFFVFVSFAVFPFFESILTEFLNYETGGKAGRIASIYSGFMVWLNNNVFFGVGLGQCEVYQLEYAPVWSWSFTNIYDEGERLPGVHSMFIRILADCGIFGILFFLLIFLIVIQKIVMVLNSAAILKKEKVFFYGVAALLSVLGILVDISFTTGGLNKMHIWVALGLGLSYLRININSNHAI